MTVDNKKNIKKAIIITNGIMGHPERIRRLISTKSFIAGDTLIISVDGGFYNTIKLGLKPDLIIGDMDSIDEDTKKMIKKMPDADYISAPPDKDESDTQLAIDHAVRIGTENIIIGALGGRDGLAYI